MRPNLYKIASFIDRDRVSIFEDIVGENTFNKLISKLGALDDSDLNIIFGTDKKFNQIEILRNEELNRLGLHIFRIMAAECSIYERRNSLGLQNNYITEIMDSQGCLKIENFLDENIFSKIEKRIMNKESLESLPGHYNRRTGWNSHYVINEDNPSGPLAPEDMSFIINNFYSNKKLASIVGNFCGVKRFSYNHMHLEKMKFVKQDPQGEIHIDTFFSSIKFWLFLHDVELENGPFCYSVGSCKNTKEKLQWEYEQSIVAHMSKNSGHREGSFRISSDDLTKRLKLPEPEKLLANKNTLILQNNRGFHKRHIANPDMFRVGLYGDLRVAPFLST